MPASDPHTVCYSKNGGTSYTTYFYGINAQGDVEKIFRMIKNADTGEYEETVYGRYTYDAWGSVTATTAAGNTPATTTLVYRNPIRYRGYVYDNETGFYYLQSRYYDPANHRFINADGTPSTGQDFNGTNMFAYCLNKLIGFADFIFTAFSPRAAFRAVARWTPAAAGVRGAKRRSNLFEKQPEFAGNRCETAVYLRDCRVLCEHSQGQNDRFSTR